VPRSPRHASTEKFEVRSKANEPSKRGSDYSTSRVDSPKSVNRVPTPRWCPPDLSKTQRGRLQKMRKREQEQAKEEAARDAWFNEAWPMTVPQKTWKEKRIEREDRRSDDGNSSSSDRVGDEVEVNMVFELTAEFWAPEAEITELVLGAMMVSFEKPERLGHHMKPLFVTGYVEIRPVQHVMVDGSARVIVMSMAMFERLGFKESELMKTNTSLSAFMGEVTEARGSCL
jgi:hypothetical protein